MSSIREVLGYGQETLEAAGKDGASFDARALLSFVMDIPFRDIPLKLENEVSDEKKKRFSELIERRLAGEPLQYITGEQEFMGLPILVDERVLIPRLDTEILAEKVLEYAGERSLKILDLCCGSGAIGLSVAALSGNSVVTLSDISLDCISVAELNAERLGVRDRVKIIHSDLFDDMEGRFDLIVSNPPYIRSDVICTLDTEVKDHEPMLALDGGADGLDIYRKIICEAPDHLNENGRLMMEIGYDQADDIKGLAEGSGFSEVDILKDLAGLDRVAVLKY